MNLPELKAQLEQVVAQRHARDAWQRDARATLERYGVSGVEWLPQDEYDRLAQGFRALRDPQSLYRDLERLEHVASELAEVQVLEGWYRLLDPRPAQ